MATRLQTKKSPKLRVFAANERAVMRDYCGTCAAAQQITRGRVECHRNPPSTTTTGRSAWPVVNPDTDWCTKWIGKLE